jgi:hypothetical protein
MINEANLVRDYFPEPPTPTNKACPADGITILQILQICFIASSKRTNPIYAKLSLYSLKASVKCNSNLSLGI